MTVLGYENKQTIRAVAVSTVADLMAQLSEIVELYGDAELIYVQDGQSNDVSVRLIENTLTDGSKTYDVRIS